MRRADTASAAYVAAATAWAGEVLRGLADGRRAGEGGLPATDARAELAARFRLDDGERRLIDLLLGLERSLAAGRLLRELSGRSRPTVELLRAALGDEVEEALAGRGRLRRHGLCVVAGLPAGAPGPTAAVALAPGMAARLAGMALAADEIGPGVEIVPPPAARPALPEALAAAVRDHMVGAEPVWATIAGARSGDGQLLAEALAHRLSRPVLLVDGRLAGALEAAEAWSFLAALRREADLADAALVVDAAASLRGAWRALAAPAPAAAKPRTIALLNLEARAPGPEGFMSHAVVFVAGAGGPALDAAAAPVDRLEAARRQAAVDAARAMGKPIPGVDEPVRSSIQRPAAPPEVEPATLTVSLAEPAAEARPVPAKPAEAPPPKPAEAPPPKRAEAPPPKPAEAPPVEAKPFPPPPAKPAETPPAEAKPFPPPPSKPFPPPPAAKPFPPPPSAPAEAKPFPPPPAKPFPPPPAKPFPPPPARPVTDAVPPPPAEAAPPPAEAAAPPPAEAAPAAEAIPAEDLPFVTIPDDAGIADLVRIAYTCANPRQRAELLTRLASGEKDVNVLKLLRAHTSSTHPLIREAAEAGLARMFGTTWGKARPITPPVQPPRSDDDR